MRRPVPARHRPTVAAVVRWLRLATLVVDETTRLLRSVVALATTGVVLYLVVRPWR
jgi:hypothetical protein